MTNPTNILHIDASMRKTDSYSRKLTQQVVENLRAQNPAAQVKRRDLADSAIPFVDETWINANFTDEDARTDEQHAALALSQSLVEELQEADTIVIGTPIYNFSIPAALKAWIDFIARARLTFRYTENGPVGLLENKKVILAIATGGTQIDSEADFATPYLRHILGFVGLKDVDVVGADLLMQDESRFEAAIESIKAA
jgi:FMN-dependent NADH-azoreductase